MHLLADFWSKLWPQASNIDPSKPICFLVVLALVGFLIILLCLLR
jgi:hypothetical protein